MQRPHILKLVIITLCATQAWSILNPQVSASPLAAPFKKSASHFDQTRQLNPGTPASSDTDSDDVFVFESPDTLVSDDSLNSLSRESAPVGAIVGGVSGGIVVLVVIIGLVWRFRIRSVVADESPEQQLNHHMPN